VIGCIRKILENQCSDPVKSVGFSVLGAGIIPIDKNLNPVYNCITALDNRSVKQVRELEKKFGRNELYHETGMPSHPFCVINKLVWFKEEMPEVFDKTWKFLNLEQYIRLKWGIEPYIDYSLGSCTMALSIKEGKWSKKILDFAGINQDLLPKVCNSSQVIGSISKRISDDTGLPEGAKVVAGGHDQVCGTLGAGVLDAGMALDSTGTVEAIVPVSNKPILTKKMLDSGVLWEFHTIPGIFMGIAVNFTAGSVLRWFRDNFCENEISKAHEQNLNVYDLILPKEDWLPSNILVLPHFSGSVSPWNDPESKGIIAGLTLNTSKTEIAKSIIDGITYEARQNMEIFENSGIGIKEIRAIGGACNDKKWLQLKADVMGKVISVPDVTEASSLGAAILAGYGIGLYKTIKETAGNMIKVNEVYYPDSKNKDLYEEKYSLYKKMYPLLKDFLHELQ